VPAEDLLDEHRTGHQTGHPVGEQGGQRYQRRAQSVLDKCAATAEPFGSRGADEILAEDVEHRVALIPAESGGGAQRQRERG